MCEGYGYSCDVCITMDVFDSCSCRKIAMAYINGLVTGHIMYSYLLNTSFYVFDQLFIIILFS